MLKNKAESFYYYEHLDGLSREMYDIMLQVAAEPVVTPDVGILASFDILAVDNACIDMIYNMPDGRGKAMIERVELRHGLRQLSYMKELGLGNDLYTLIDIDNGDAVITAAEAVKDVEPEWMPDIYNTFPGRNKIRKS